MGLTYDLTCVADHNNVCFTQHEEGRTLNPETECTIFMCMAVGIAEITEKTVDDFCVRAKLIQGAGGPWMRSIEDGEMVSHPLTWQDIHKHVGLKTNASSLTKTEFQKKIYLMAEEELKREKRMSIEEKETEHEDQVNRCGERVSA